MLSICNNAVIYFGKLNNAVGSALFLYAVDLGRRYLYVDDEQVGKVVVLRELSVEPRLPPE